MILALPEPGGIRIRDTARPRVTTDFIHCIGRGYSTLQPQVQVARYYNVAVDSVRMVATLKELRAK